MSEPVYLIHMNYPEDWETLAEELKKEFSRCSVHFALSEYEDTPRDYLLGTLSGDLRWGEDNELRPLGVHSKDYSVIGGGAVSLGEYLSVLRLFGSLRFDRGGEYVVRRTEELFQTLKADGYRFLHRPYFAMMGSSHSFLTVTPRAKIAVDAGKIDEENISAEEFMRIYGESLVNETPMDFPDFRERVKDTPPCDDVLTDPETGAVTGLQGQHRGILRLPEGLTEIAERGLKQPYITDLVLPATMVELGECALAGCHSLRRVYLPVSVRRINKWGFNTSLLDLYYGGSKELWDSLQNKNPTTRKGKRDGIAFYGNDYTFEHANIHFDCALG